jgi:hypothetical protein
MMTVAARSSPRMSRICPQCEYDLTGLPEPCVCPECGRAIEAGLRAVPVWSESGKPSWIAILILSLFGFPTVIGAGHALLSQTLDVRGAFLGCLGLLFAIAALIEVRKSLWSAQGKTSALLHTSPRGVAMSERGSVRWYDWAEVKRLRYERSLLGVDWILTIEGFNPWYLGTRVLLRATFRYSRRRAASVRNTLRCHHRAWQKAQTQDQV